MAEAHPQIRVNSFDWKRFSTGFAGCARDGTALNPVEVFLRFRTDTIAAVQSDIGWDRMQRSDVASSLLLDSLPASSAMIHPRKWMLVAGLRCLPRGREKRSPVRIGNGLSVVNGNRLIVVLPQSQLL